MTLLEVTDLRVAIATPAGDVQAVRGVDFELAAGQTLALVGESGCGKSITALSILGLAPGGSRITGSVRWRGRQLLGMPQAGLRRLRGVDIALIGQNPMAALNPIQRVGDQIAEMLVVHRGWSRPRAAQRAVELLGEMQLPDPERQARQFPFEFSGGMLQRAAIAMAVACEPQLLIADEPTTALDVTVQAQVLALLARLRDKRGMALLLITHDLGVVARMADRVAVMYAGEIVESAPAGPLFERRGHPYSTGLKQALPERVHRGERLAAIPGSPPDLLAPPAGCGFGARCPHAMAICAEGRVPVFSLGDRPEKEPGDGHASRCWLHHPDCPDAQTAAADRSRAGEKTVDERPADARPIRDVDDAPRRTASVEPLLRVEGLARHFPHGGRRGGVLRALDGVDFQLRSGEVLGVVGESGSGKSTLGKTLLGLHGKTAGQVWLKGEPLPQQYGRADFLRYSAVAQMVFQDPYATLNPRLTVGMSLAEPLRIQGHRQQLDGRIASALQRVGLAAEAAGRYPHEFSGGQRQRIGIARALIAGPELLICDEPVSALDVSVQAQIVNLLGTLRSELALAMLFIAHDLALVRYLCDRVLVMYRGRVVEEGPIPETFDQPRHPYTRQLLDANPTAEPTRRDRPGAEVGGEIGAGAYAASGAVAPAVVPARILSDASASAGLTDDPGGCAFAPRCPRVQHRCRQSQPVLEPHGAGRSACFFPLE